MKAAPLSHQIYITYGCCWSCGVVGDAPASSKAVAKADPGIAEWQRDLAGFRFATFYVAMRSRR